MSEAKIGLRVNGREYRGWQSISVTRSIESLSGSFQFAVSERWAGRNITWPIKEADECSVVINGSPLITGYIDTRDLDFNADDHTVGVTGRDRAGDMIDCSVLLSQWHFTNTDVLALAQKIAAPFGIKVTLQAGISPALLTVPKKHSIDPGDTAHAALENVCRLAGLLPISDGLGGIVLTRAGRSVCGSSIIEGKNLKAGHSRFSARGKFRTYEVLGSHKGRDDLSGPSAAGVRGSATDLSARDGRTLVIRPEGNVTKAQAKMRAEWEAAVRAGRADEVSVTVQGWTQADGTPWPLNKRVRIESPRLRVRGDMLITQVTFQLGDAGTTTQLELRDPSAFLPDPLLGLKGGSGNNFWKEIEKGV